MALKTPLDVALMTLDTIVEQMEAVRLRRKRPTYVRRRIEAETAVFIRTCVRENIALWCGDADDERPQ